MKFLRSVLQSRELVTERTPAGLRGVASPELRPSFPPSMRIPTKGVLFFIACLSTTIVFAAQTPDSEYESVAEEYIKGFLGARPILATSLGFHEYDGKSARTRRRAFAAKTF